MSQVPGVEKVFYAWLRYSDIGHLEGKVLTIIDAVVCDPKQNKATKDLIRQAIWFDWANCLDRVQNDVPVGMPEECFENNILS